MNYARVLRQVFPCEGRLARAIRPGDDDATGGISFVVIRVSKPQPLTPTVHFLEMEVAGAKFFEFAGFHGFCATTLPSCQMEMGVP